MQATTKGYIDLTLGQVSVAVNIVLAKHLLTIMPPFVFLGIRFGISSLILTLMVAARGFRVIGPEHPTGRMAGKDWGLLWGQALTAGFLFNYLFTVGMQYTNATSAGIITSILPAMIAIFSFWMLKERLTWRKQLGILLAMIGIGILGWNNPHGSDTATGGFIGDFLIFMALVPEALFSILGKLIGRRLDALGCAMFTNIFTLLLILPLMFVGLMNVSVTDFTPETWGLLFIGGLGSVGFYWLWSRGLQIIPTSTAGIFGSVTPVATCVIAILFLSEVPTWYDFWGMMFVILSIFVGTGTKWPWPRRKATNA